MAQNRNQEQAEEIADALINRDNGINYWESIDASVDGMLGGFPHISRADIRGSRNFLAKLCIGSKPGLHVAGSALEGGAGWVSLPIA